MEIIPVVDLKGGTVVHARMGRRELYRPIETPLAVSSDPVDVTRGLLSIYPFASVYVADLDAIEGADDNRATVARLKEAFPKTTLWIDSGVADWHAATAWLRQDLGYLVLGSETQIDSVVACRLAGDPRVVLSLDFRGGEFQGPPALLTRSECWPQRVIAMTLDRVGSHAGPDLDRLRAVKTTAATRKVYAAGGVRDVADIHALAKAGITGALVASSLHDGRLTANDLRLAE
jgi:phosphoribosylformimino-5-aminoimidazole carboxamide ribotide isomerase